MYCRAFPSFVVACICALAGFTHAAEIVVSNDSAPPSTHLPNLVSGETAGVWLTAPVSGHIVGVQIDWKTLFGGGPTLTEGAIKIFDGSTFPSPGALLATIPSPSMQDIGINEFRHLDAAQTVLLSVPVTAGNTYVVAIELFNTQSGPFSPAQTYDADGCQPGLNAAAALPGPVWADACLLGVPGDFVMRAIILPPTPVPVIPTGGALLLALLLLGCAARLGHGRAAADIG